METDCKGDAGSLPQSFTVPRDTRLVEVTACDWDQLRWVRTELELLRRIRRCVLRGFAASVRVDRAASKRYSPAAREELAAILCDACHPVVDETLTSIDRQFGRLRREIMMSAVNEEAENIVQEGVESGAIDPGSTTPDASDPEGESSDGAGSADIHEALAQAEAALADAAVGLASEPLPTPQQPNESSPTADAFPEPVEAEEASCETDVAEAACPEPEAMPESQSVEPTDSADPPHDVDASQDNDALQDQDSDAPHGVSAKVPEETSSEVAPSDALAETSEDPTDIAASTEAHDATVDSQPTSENAEAFDGSFTPERAERAVEEIERGIRKLASVLSTEVSEKWTHANSALQEVAQTGTRIEEVYAKAIQALSDLDRLKDEAQIARMEADVARREAKLFREDAKRAKQRAETSAAAAELSADQATRDAHAAAGTRT